MTETPFDPGLQPERVSLAWQRTALAIGVGALVYARIILHEVGLFALVPASAGILLSLAMGLKARIRYEHHHRVLTRGSGHIADAAFLAIVAACVSGAGVFALVVLLLSSRL